jgi:hypothetical protein
VPQLSSQPRSSTCGCIIIGTQDRERRARCHGTPPGATPRMVNARPLIRMAARQHRIAAKRDCPTRSSGRHTERCRGPIVFGMKKPPIAGLTPSTSKCCLSPVAPRCDPLATASPWGRFDRRQCRRASGPVVKLTVQQKECDGDCSLEKSTDRRVAGGGRSRAHSGRRRRLCWHRWPAPAIECGGKIWVRATL